MAPAPNSLATVIHCAGLYRCRNGKLATIHEIRYLPDHKPEHTAFHAKGSKWTKKVGQVNPPYNAWHSGHCGSFMSERQQYLGYPKCGGDNAP